MNPTLAVEYCRIVAPEKLPDRFLVSGVIQNPETTGSLADVFVAYVFEVNKPWFPSSKIFPTLIQTLEAQAPGLTSGKELADQFEGLLKELNQQLNAISEQGETDWIGNLNGLIMVLGGDELHFSQTGHCPAYILQNNRIRQITDDSNGDHEPHPLKTFTNLASGTLHEGDYVLLSNQELYHEISLDALRRVMNNNSPAAACASIVRELKKERTLTVSSIIIRTPSQAQAETALSEPEPLEIVLEEEMQSPFKKFQKRLAPIIARGKEQSAVIGRTSLEAAKKASSTVKEKAAPVAATLIEKGAQRASAVKNKVASKVEAEPLAVVEIIEPQSKKAEKEPNPEPAKAEKEEAVATEDEKEFFPEEPEEENSPSIIPADELALSSSVVIPKKKKAKADTSLKERFTILIATPQRKKLAALSLALVLIVLTGLTAFYRHNPSNLTPTANQNEESLKTAQDLLQKATTARELKQDIEAARELEEGQRLLNSLSGLSDNQKKQADELWDTYNLQADSLTNTTRLAEATATYTFSGAAQHMISALPYFYGTTGNTPSLLRIGKGDPAVTAATIDLPDSTDATIAAVHSSEADTSGYVLTRKNNVYRLTQSGSTSSLRPITLSSGDFAPGDAIGTYNGNVYILDGKTGLLWKYAFTGTAYSKGTSIIDSTKYDIKKGVSLAIDGSIYVLKSDGSVLKFTSGEQDPFAFSNQPSLYKELVQPLQIATNESTQSIYLLDGGITSGRHSTARVLEFTKEGSFVRQYALPKDFLQVRSFEVDPKEGKLWVLNDKTVSEFNL